MNQDSASASRNAASSSDSDSEDDQPPAPALTLVSDTRISNFDLERVPLHLREIFIYAQRFGKSDESERRRLLQKTTPGELRQALDAVAPYLDDISEWADSGEQSSELESYISLAHGYREMETNLSDPAS